MSTQRSNEQDSKATVTNGNSNRTKAIVLVHGGFVDGSGWAGVYSLLKKKGYNVLIAQNPTKSFAADVDPETASFMVDSQVPWGVDALAGTVSEPAWKTKPSYYLVATEDKMIPPPAQRAMAGRVKAQMMEVPGSHAVYVPKPAEV